MGPDSQRSPNPLTRLRARLNERLTTASWWTALNAAAEPIATPIRAFATAALVRAPWLERWDWLLETRALARRSPIAIALPAVICGWRGVVVTQFGHIGTDLAIYPIIAATSSFN